MVGTVSGPSRISGKGVHMYKDVGLAFQGQGMTGHLENCQGNLKVLANVLELLGNFEK